MAMVKCEYCGSYINDIEEKCPNCGKMLVKKKDIIKCSECDYEK